MREEKKWLTVLCIILLMKVSYAEIVLEGPAKEKVNLGDELAINGYIQEPNNALVSFKVLLKCKQEQLLKMRTISITANVKSDFQENVLMLNHDEETCTIAARVESSNINEQTQSKPFAITKELRGNFRLDRGTIKLGDELRIKGDIFKLDGAAVDGVAQIHLKQGSNDYFTDMQRVVQGKLDYIFRALQNPAGNYTVEIKVTDVHGNRQVFNVGAFSITNNIILTTEINKLHAPPGTKIKLFGKAVIFDKPIEKGTARIKYFDKQQESEFKEGTFTVTLEIPDNAKTGDHNIEVFVVDEFGNYGSYAQKLVVDASPKKIDITTNKDTFFPGETIVVTQKIKDQGDEVVHEQITTRVVAPNGKEALTELLASNTEFKFTIASTATPGLWHIEASALGLKESASFIVAEKEAVTYEMNKQVLTVTNRGNVKFEGPIEIALESLEKSATIIKEINLDVGETTSISLAREVTPGIYDVRINGRVFKNVRIEGKGRIGYAWLWYLLAAGVVMTMIALLYRTKKRGLRRKSSMPLKKRGSFDGYVNIRNMESDTKQKKPLQFKIKKSADQYICKEPKIDKKEGYPDRTYAYRPKDQDKKNSKDGLFSMFD